MENVEMKKNVITKSKIKCPYCGFEKEEEMPTDACVHFYECSSCGKILKPKEGKCCVFCSYGSVKCPPKQLEEKIINKFNKEKYERNKSNNQRIQIR